MKLQTAHPLATARYTAWLAVLVVAAVCIATFLVWRGGSNSDTGTPGADTPSSAVQHFVYQKPFRLSSGKYLSP